MPLKLLKCQFLTFKYHPKLISRKIRGVGKLLNFHTVEYQLLQFPIRLPSSVIMNKLDTLIAFLLIQ